MKKQVNRREFIQLTLAGGALCFAGRNAFTFAADAPASKLIAPGNRTSKVKVARIFVGKEGIHWPKPTLKLADEVRFYKEKFDRMKDQFADVDFVADELVGSPEDLNRVKGAINDADGVLVIHLAMGVGPAINALAATGRPTMIFAAPYSGHEWVGFGELRKKHPIDCILTTDYTQLAAAVRPFRAIHNLKCAKILNVTTRDFTQYAADMKTKFATEMKQIDLERTLAAYNAVPEADAKAEADRWIKGAEKVVEPSEQEIVKSCRLALAFDKLLDEEKATVITADCYGSMYKPLCQAQAFPCIGFTRINDMGFGGICESDLPCAMTYIILQGLSGKPSFISDPTVDQSGNSIILAHCLGSRKMEGPEGAAAPYKIRTIMERQEGAVTQVQMPVGKKVTQTILVGTDFMPYFTGEVIAAPVALEDDRGCRTKITVKVDGDAEKLWQNWSNGLHRLTCYGDLTKDLQRFCKFKNIKMVNEAV